MLCNKPFHTPQLNNKKLLNITEMAQGFRPVHTSGLLSLHAFTGCDSSSAFN